MFILNNFAPNEIYCTKLWGFVKRQTLEDYLEFQDIVVNTLRVFGNNTIVVGAQPPETSVKVKVVRVYALFSYPEVLYAV